MQFNNKQSGAIETILTIIGSIAILGGLMLGSIATTQQKPVQTPSLARETNPPSSPDTRYYPMKGNIIVYSCKKPDSVRVELYCAHEFEPCEVLQESNQPADLSVWLDDDNTDRTWIYSYDYTTTNHNTIESQMPIATVNGKEYTQRSDNQFFYSNNFSFIIRTDNDTCKCPYYANNWIIDAQTGQPINALDNKTEFGTINDRFASRLNKNSPHGAPFINGQRAYQSNDRNDQILPDYYGRDSFANIKLYYDSNNYSIVGQKCISSGQNNSCPNDSAYWEANADNLAQPDVFTGIRYHCDQEVEYGWLLAKNTLTPTPIIPTQSPRPHLDEPMKNKAISCELRDFAKTNTQEPNSICGVSNLLITAVEDEELDIEYTLPVNCPSFVRGRDKVWTIVTAEKNGAEFIVASKNTTKDDDTTIDAKHGNGLPNCRTSPDHPLCPWGPRYNNTEKGRPGKPVYEWESGVLHHVYVYTYLSSNDSCVSIPAKASFIGGGEVPTPTLRPGETRIYDSSSLVLMEANQNQGGTAQIGCYRSSNRDTETSSTHDGGPYETPFGQYSCSSSLINRIDGITKGYSVTFTNNTLFANTENPGEPNMKNKNQARIFWQISRCQNNEDVCKKDPTGADGNKIHEASQLICVSPGQSLTCEWKSVNNISSAVFCSGANKCEYLSSGITNQEKYNNDINGDGEVNLADLAYIIDQYGSEGSNVKGDINEDGLINSMDLSSVIENI